MISEFIDRLLAKALRRIRSRMPSGIRMIVLSALRVATAMRSDISLISMSRQDPQLKLRLPDGMRDRLKKRAEENGRSMNAEIVQRLAESLRDELVFEIEALKNPELLDGIQGEISAAVEEASGSGQPVNMVFTARLLRQMNSIEQRIDEKLERLGRGVPPTARRAGQSSEDFLTSPEGQEFRRRHEEKWDSDIAAREQAGENIKPLPRRSKATPARKPKIKFDPL